MCVRRRSEDVSGVDVEGWKRKRKRQPKIFLLLFLFSSVSFHTSSVLLFVLLACSILSALFGRFIIPLCFTLFLFLLVLFGFVVYVHVVYLFLYIYI